MGKARRKINLLFVLLQISTGGTERVVLDLARNLDDSLFNVYLAFLNDGILQGSFKEVCQEVFHVPRKGGMDVGAMMRIGRIIRERSIDVINAHHYAPLFYSLLGGKILGNKRVVYTEHSVAELEWISSMRKRFCNLVFYGPDVIVGVSNQVTDFLHMEFPAHAHKIESIPNGVDVDKFAVPVDRDMVRSRWSLLPEHFVIGAIANFRAVKNHTCLIRAFHSLSQAHQNVRLVLVGRGFPGDSENTEDEIKNLINELDLDNRVILTGYREDVPELLKSFDLFCLPSLSEGLPVSMLEAMAAGVVVVGSDVRGIDQVISPGETGMLFPSNDHEALAGKMKRLIEDPALAEALRRAALAHVSRTHGIKQWVNNYERLFQG